MEITRGKLLGGSSSINFMAYTRGNRRDYDTWASLIGDPSWSWDNVLPYYKKSEKMLDPNILNTHNRRNHGTKGYVKITRPHLKVIDNYLKAFEEVGNDIHTDLNGGDNLGYGQMYTTVADGIRQSTAISFLSNIKDRKNLHVLKNTVVSKVVFNTNKAVGVEVILENGKCITLKAREEVIVSAGAINTPQILMLSGIGPKNHLNNMGIKVIKDLPVGQGLKDHAGVFVIQKMNEIEASDGPFTVNLDNFPEALIEGYAALNSSQRYLDYQSVNFILEDSQAILQFCGYFYGFIDEICQEYFEAIRGKQYLKSIVSMMYPESSGRILLNSTNPKDPPLIYMGYHSKKSDIHSHATYLKHFLKVNRSKFFRSANSELVVPKLCGCGNFVDTSEFYQCFVSCNLVPMLHYIGTCPMGTVLDSRLKVIGLKSIRVVDASVTPTIISSNMNAPTMMIAEKASDMIKEDYFVKECIYR